MTTESTYGGKGAALLRAIAAFLPVPPTYFVAADGNRDLVSPATMAAYGLIAPYAVRSSAAVEDGAKASFAGIFESCLNVQADQLQDAIRRVDASAVAMSASRYRKAMGAPEDTAMAIVIQSFIDADFSGVMVSRHDSTLIEAVQGLGEAIAQGLVTPDSYLFRHESATTAISVGMQAVRIEAAPGGGTREQPCERTGQLLPHETIYDLVGLANQCQHVFAEWPTLDIEWCIKDGIIYLLQVRPVTA